MHRCAGTGIQHGEPRVRVLHFDRKHRYVVNANTVRTTLLHKERHVLYARHVLYL